MPAAIALLVAVAALGYYGLRSCRETEEDRVRAVIDEIEAAIEERDVGDVMPHIADDYRDPEGLEKPAIRLLLMREVLQGGEAISIQRRATTDVTLRGPQKKRTGATASFRALVGGGGSLRAALGDGETWDFEVDLRRGDDDAWRVVSHRRARVQSP